MVVMCGRRTRRLLLLLLLLLLMSSRRIGSHRALRHPIQVRLLQVCDPGNREVEIVGSRPLHAGSVRGVCRLGWCRHGRIERRHDRARRTKVRRT